LNKYIIGEKSVYFNGRIFVGPLKSRVVTALMVLILPLGTLCVKRSKMGAEASALELSDWVLETALFAGTISLFLMCALLDPGIITRDPLGVVENGLEIRNVEFNGRTHTLNFCIECQVYRPLRSYHCNNCGTCIEEMDHHCSWMGTCIGRRNRLKFCSFLAMGIFYCGKSYGLFFQPILQDDGEKINSLNIIFVIQMLVLGGFLSSLLFIQIALISKGLTTVEFLRSYTRTRIKPFDQGFFGNWKNFWTCDRSSRMLSFDLIRKLQSNDYTGLTDETLDTSLNISLVQNLE